MVQKPEFDPNKAIETGDLTPIVRRIVDSPRAEVAGVWKAEKIGRSAGFGTVGIFRVAGEAITPEGKRSWSVVLKVLDESVGGVGGDFNTPALELAAYRSGLFEQSPDAAGFRSSTCYAIDVKADGSHWLWIEDLSGSPVPPWPDALYVSVARHVGQFNGEWATRGSDYPAFLKKGGYWHGLPRNGPSEAFQRVLIARDNPLVRRCLPPDMIERASRLGQEAFYCYQKLDQFPVTICHTDCHPKNLFPLVNHGRHTATVAVDWGSVRGGRVRLNS